MIQDILLAGIKFTICISIVVILYKTLLRSLTFFKMIRWYFLAGIVLSVLISCFTITIKTPVEQNPTLAHQIVNQLPTINTLVHLREEPAQANTIQYKQVLLSIWWAGLLVFVVRLMIQFLSLIHLRKRSKSIKHGPLRIYLLQDKISSFAFGNSIFIHPGELHQADYEKIIEHEWIHIRQQHTLDMLIGEIICIIQWFNPFAWILKKSIRQNLEYLTDDSMLHKGTDAMEYQYLLLRAVRQGAFRFTLTFNYHSLKSRIIMINRFKSHPVQRVRFLLLAPLLLFVLFAFRSASPVIIKYSAGLIPSSFDNSLSKSGQGVTGIAPTPILSPATDTVPSSSKSKHRSSRNDDGEYSLSWSDDDNDKIKRITIQGDSKNGDVATVFLKNGEKEIYDLNNNDARDQFEDKYGDLIQNHLPLIPPIPPMPPIPTIAPIPPMPPMPPIPSIASIPPMPPMPSIGFGLDLPDDVTEISQTSESVKLKFKDGTTESYDLTDPKQKKKFREKYNHHYYRED